MKIQRKLEQSYWEADTSKRIREDVTIVKMLREVAATVPDRLALVQGVVDKDKRMRWTYAQLLKDSERFARALLSHFKPGTHVAIWAPNVIEWALIEYGCAVAGMTLVTISPGFKSREVEYILNKSEAAALFYAEGYRGHHFGDTLDKISDKLKHLQKKICISEIDAFLASGDETIALPEVQPTDPCVIMFTSGTTGYPKGAILHHMGMVNSNALMAERLGMEIGGVWINVMPMFHMGGAGFATLGALTRQGTHVLAEGFDPNLFLKLVEEEKGTVSLLVPTMLEAILASPECNKYNLSTLKSIQSGASKVEAKLVRKVKDELGCGMSIVFGQTEAHGGFTQTHIDDNPEDQANTIGQPYAMCEVKIADSFTGEILPIGEEGEICCRGYQTMLGYFKMPEETSKALKSDGWLHTGDLGSMDVRGFLKIKGRVKDMIIRGGENIYPAEIENLLIEHPKIEKAVVVGVPDEYWGEQVASVIIPRSPDDLPDTKELDQYCLDNIARYKRPRYWFLIPEIPVTEAGKIRKFMIQDMIKRSELQELK